MRYPLAMCLGALLFMSQTTGINMSTAAPVTTIDSGSGSGMPVDYFVSGSGTGTGSGSGSGSGMFPTPGEDLPGFFYSTLRSTELDFFSDDGNSQPVYLPGPFQYFEAFHDRIYINENGFLSFSFLNKYSPDPNAGQDIIAPLWTSMNSAIGGKIFYEIVRDGPLLSRASEEINKLFSYVYFSPIWLFIATWDKVSFATDTGDATFQAVLATDGDITYVLMNYGQITPTEQPWLAGYQTADLSHNFTFQEENPSDLSTDSNIGTPGQWAFPVTDEAFPTCDKLKCTENEVCAERTGIFGCECAENNTRPNPQTFDATETCASSSGTVSLSRCQLFEAGFPAEYLHLNDPKCRGEIQGDLVVFQFDNAANICGTTLKSNKTHFFYENSIHTFINVDPKLVISRESWLNIPFSCVYPLIQSISMPMPIQAGKSVVSKMLSTEGTYEIHMVPYPNNSFIEPLSGNVTIDVNQKLYVAVEVDGVDDSQIASVLDNCWATPVEDRNSSIRWDLIINECPNPLDGTVQVLQNGKTTSSYFSFTMFTFTGVSSNVYLHCQVHLCLLEGGNCTQQCDDDLARRRRSLAFHDTAAITMGF